MSDPSPLFTMLANTFGPIKKVVTLHRENYNEFAGISIMGNRPEYWGIYTCSVDCQAGPATVTIGVMHKDNRWSIIHFNVDSKLLGKMNESDRTASKNYVNKLLPELCANLNLDFLKKNADPILMTELRDNMKAATANCMFFAVSKALGSFKKCDKVSSGGFTPVQGGQYVYRYAAEAEFEHGTGTLSIWVVKHNGEWRLRAFKIEERS